MSNQLMVILRLIFAPFSRKFKKYSIAEMNFDICIYCFVYFRKKFETNKIVNERKRQSQRSEAAVGKKFDSFILIQYFTFLKFNH